MKVSVEQIEIPDKCPEDCKFKKGYDWDTCIRCPIWNCSNPNNDPALPAIKPEDYRADWAREWVRFFTKETPNPQLFLAKEKNL